MNTMERTKKGFSLVEVSLVLGVASFVGFLTFSQFLKQQEIKKAEYAGLQIKQLGDATNAYITSHYDTLVTFVNSSGSTNDIGPRNCTAGNSSCVITIMTLINEGLLPSSFSGTNVYGHGYNILLKRTGVSPYYKINGIIVTDSALKIGERIRYDLLGQAILSAGIDSGMTRDSSSQVSGFNGSWTAVNNDYPVINKSGLLAYQVGYGTYNYSVFLRRDGSLPMTGSLNMGSNSIVNSVNYSGSGSISTGTSITAGTTITAGDSITSGNNITATNNITANNNLIANNSISAAKNINAGNNIIAGGEVSARNAYGDTITMGGDASNLDYELRLNTIKPLSVFAPSLASNLRASTTIFKTFGGMQVIGNQLVDFSVITNGLSINDVPANMLGGVVAPDFYGLGGIYLSKGDSPSKQNWAFMAQNNGNVQASGNITAGGDIKGKTLLATSVYNYGDTCSTPGVISKDSNGSILICGSNNRMIKAGSVIDVFKQELSASLPLTATTDTVCVGNTGGSQQQYSTTITPIQDEVIDIAFTGALTSTSKTPTTTDERLSNLTTGTACIYINNNICGALSNIGLGRSGSLSCNNELKAGQSYTLRFVLGNQTDPAVKARNFLVQYVRHAK